MTDYLITPFTILRDTREQHGWSFRDIPSDAKDGGRRWLPKLEDCWLGDHLGDYTIKGMGEPGKSWRVSVERKSLEDFYATILGRREQFEVELRNLNLMDCGAVVVEVQWSDVFNYRPIHWDMEGIDQSERDHRLKTLFRSVVAWQQGKYFPRVHWWMMPGKRAAEICAFRILERFWRQHGHETDEGRGGPALFDKHGMG